MFVIFIIQLFCMVLLIFSDLLFIFQSIYIYLYSHLTTEHHSAQSELQKNREVITVTRDALQKTEGDLIALQTQLVTLQSDEQITKVYIYVYFVIIIIICMFYTYSSIVDVDVVDKLYHGSRLMTFEL